PPTPEIASILNQSFSYFAKGQQSFVFLSADGQYVLKLFRFYTSKIPYGRRIETLLKQWVDPTVQPRNSFAFDVQTNFDSCKTASDLAPDPTGLIYIHLNPRSLPLLHLKDRLGRTHSIDPAKYRFVLQKK